MAQAKFLEGNLMRHVVSMAFASSIGLMALFFVDFLDMIFISMLGEAELAAAVGYAGSILFFTTSIGIGIAITTGALVARTLGQGDAERAKAFGTHVLVTGFVFGSFAAALVWIFVPDLLSFFGAKDRTLRLATEYLRIIVPSLPVLILAMCGGAILRAHGDARRSMWSTIAGGIVNAVLDPILIFGLDMKLQGAAWGSVAARVAVLIFAFWPIFKLYGGLIRPRLAGVLQDLNAIVGLAVPAMLTNVATPIGAAYVTRAVAQFGDEAVAGTAIISRLVPVSFAVVFALSGAIGPIVGQNFGARQYDRVRGTLINGLLFAGAYAVFVSVVLFLLRDSIGWLFSADGTALALIYLFCGPLSLAWFFNGALFVANASFNNLNRPTWSTILNWGRNTLGTMPFVSLGTQYWGAAGALIGQAAGGVIFAGIGVWLAFHLIRSYEDGRIDPDKRRRPIFQWYRPLNPHTNSRVERLQAALKASFRRF